MTYDYSQLPELTGFLKRAAIDAYMRSEEGYEIIGSHYWKQGIPDPNSGIEVSETVSLPDPNGENGGDYTTTALFGDLMEDLDGHRRDKEFSEKFSSIRSKIDAIVNPWMNLPDPQGMADELTRYRNGVVVQLASEMGEVRLPDPGTNIPGVNEEGQDEHPPTNVTPGPIGKYTGDLSLGSAKLEGQAMYAFKQLYVTRLPLVIKNLCVLSNLHASSLLAEQRAFLGVRTQITKAVVDATTAFNQIAAKQDASFDIGLDVLGWGLAALALPTEGVGAILVGVAQIIQTIVKDMKSEAEKLTVQGNTYTSMISEFEKSISAFAEKFKAMEEKVAVALNSFSSDLVKGDQGKDFDDANFHLVRPDSSVVHDGGNEKEVTAIDGDSVQTAVDLLGKISYLLGNSAAELNRSDMAAVVTRPGAVGMAPSGPSTAYGDLRQRLYELILDLNWQVDAGAAALLKTYEDFDYADGESQTDLENLNETIEQGSGVNPYDDSSQDKRGDITINRR